MGENLEKLCEDLRKNIKEVGTIIMISYKNLKDANALVRKTQSGISKVDKQC